MTLTAPDPTLSLAERRAAYEAKMLASFDPTVPGIPGDGSPKVLHTDPERGLTYTWYDISRRVQDFTSRERGFLVSRLSVTYRTSAGEDIEVAYLNVTHTTKELVAAELPTPFHWADENTGAPFGFQWAAEDGRTVSDQKIWATAYTALSMTPPSARDRRSWAALSASEAPTDPQVLTEELAVVEKVYARQMRGFVRWLSVPFVDFSHVDDARDAAAKPGHPGGLRGTGIGRQMYLLAAQHLAASFGKVLRASGCQSEDAERLWQRLIADPTVPTRHTRITYYRPTEKQVTTYPCIDFTRG